ncbi:guanine nucleotide binding protein, alpha subunit [Multifurca ochricompacta]|uniref:Guanine nucleotide binding protein, alpha subunit n=1 Tax=Multifurca ochricompacta TaxID=376703 RepID=A0AAD4QIT3_9AGAM|nr:guanine nucleotide binding protein, alpha subunit [Multifurca ochricompacta]
MSVPMPRRACVATRAAPWTLYNISMVRLGHKSNGSQDLLIQRSESPLADVRRCKTPQQRVVRETEEEAEARRASERIDEQIVLEKRNKKSAVRVLLLGQEGSGKSSFIKVFRTLYAPKAWEEECLLWRTLIYLDVVRSVNRVLDTLGNAPEATSYWMRLIRMRLSPLRRVERDLEVHLGLAEGEEVHVADISGLAKRRQQNNPGQRSLADQAMELILASREDIAALWNDDLVRAVLEARGSPLDCHSKFFLNELHRITQRDYEPSDDDIIRARSRATPGVQEHHLLLETGPEAGCEWTFYDIGCSRTRRASWLPYLMDVNAIVFLAPISVFDERLEEDRSVNRLEDSINFWTTICKSKLITKRRTGGHRGCDILQRKLECGVRFRRYIPSYGNRANDMPTATKYLRQQFQAIARKSSPEPRIVHTHLLSSIESDNRTVAAVVSSIRQGLISDNLRKSDLTS